MRITIDGSPEEIKNLLDAIGGSKEQISYKDTKKLFKQYKKNKKLIEEAKASEKAEIDEVKNFYESKIKKASPLRRHTNEGNTAK